MKRSAQLVPRKSASRHPPMAQRRLDPATLSPSDSPSVPLSARSTNYETFRAARTSPKRFPSSAALRRVSISKVFVIAFNYELKI